MATKLSGNPMRSWLYVIDTFAVKLYVSELPFVRGKHAPLIVRTQGHYQLRTCLHTQIKTSSFDIYIVAHLTCNVIKV